MEKIKVGVIGCGGIANQKHFPALKNNSDLNEIVAFCDIKNEAPCGFTGMDLALTLIPKDRTVSWGGTVTAAQIGLMDRLHQGDYQLIDRNTGKTPAEKQELMRQALTCGTFIMSSNAISADGQLVNLDGNANRVAALCFGPESVLVIAGMNKVMGDLDSAIARARQVAAPANAQRFDIKTPCAVTGSCGDCTSPDCICCQMVITRVCRPAGRIKVILVGQDLGF